MKLWGRLATCGGLLTRLAALLCIALPVSAHRLDEYLQATMISVATDHIEAQIRLTPGVAVFPAVLASIDTDADGVISQPEQRAYAARVLRDLSLTVDGRRLPLRLISTKFPSTEEMNEGLGAIEIDFAADVPGKGSKRRLIFENHHQTAIGAYLVNCLVPRNPAIRITAQNRNYQQSLYELDYVQASVPARGGTWLGLFALTFIARFAWMWRRRTPAQSRLPNARD